MDEENLRIEIKSIKDLLVETISDTARRNMIIDLFFREKGLEGEFEEFLTEQAARFPPGRE